MIEKLSASSRTEPLQTPKVFQITNIGNITDIPFHICSVVRGKPVLGFRFLVMYSWIEPLIKNLFKIEGWLSSFIGQSINLPVIGRCLTHQFIKAEWKKVHNGCTTCERLAHLFPQVKLLGTR